MCRQHRTCCRAVRNSEYTGGLHGIESQEHDNSPWNPNPNNTTSSALSPTCLPLSSPLLRPCSLLSLKLKDSHTHACFRTSKPCTFKTAFFSFCWPYGRGNPRPPPPPWGCSVLRNLCSREVLSATTEAANPPSGQESLLSGGDSVFDGPLQALPPHPITAAHCQARTWLRRLRRVPFRHAAWHSEPWKFHVQEGKRGRSFNRTPTHLRKKHPH